MALLMPVNATIHYKTAFDVSSDGTSLMFLLRKSIKNWASHHRTVTDYGKCYLDDEWFFKGDSEQHQIGIAYIRTAANIGKYNASHPEHWAFELIHKDIKNTQRIWSINIGLTQINSQEVRFACILKHAVSENFMGTLEEPIPSVPRFVKDIVSNHRFICKKSHINLNLKHDEINSNEISHLIANILYSDRYLPLICVILDENNDYPVDAYSLHIKNIANANTYVIKYEDLPQFNEGLPYALHCKPGMVRIYKNCVANDSGKKHRYYFKEQCLEYGSKLEEIIVYALSRNANNFKASEIVEIKHVINERKLSQLNALKEGSSKDDILQLYEEEIERLNREKAEVEKFGNYCIQENEQLQEDLREAQWKADQYPCLQKEKAFLSNKIEEMRHKFSLPENLEDCLKFIEKFYPDRVAVHDEAIKSAKKFYLREDKDIIYEAWDMLMAISHELYELEFINYTPNLQNIFMEKTNIEFSFNESSTTKKNKKFEKMRKYIYNGKEVDLHPHLKSRINKSFRIHIAFLINEKKILVCHCGEHLDNAMTQHLS